jgi:hypothetical protein
MKMEFLLPALLSLVFVLAIYVGRLYRKQKAAKQAKPIIVAEQKTEVVLPPAEIVAPDQKEADDELNVSPQAEIPPVLPGEQTTPAFVQFICSCLAHSGFYRENDDFLPLSERSFILVSATDNRKIAITCVWKVACIKGRLEWAKSQQLIAFRKYQQHTGRPVFIVAGVGGSADRPEMVSVIQLDMVRSNVLSLTQLQTHVIEKENIFERQLINFTSQSEIVY